MLDYSEMDNKIQSALPLKRYIHTGGVVAEAIKLAKIYKVDEQKAKIAALLHDCVKGYSEQMMRRFCKEYHIELDEVMVEQIDLVHGFLGAEVAKREYGVTDLDILNAIKYHTIGRKGMSTLEKITYIADYIEPNRKVFDGLVEVRNIVYSDLNGAVMLALRNTIEYNKSIGRKVHSFSYEALEYLQNE